MQELGHGSNVKDIQTKAIYDITTQVILTIIFRNLLLTQLMMKHRNFG